MPISLPPLFSPHPACGCLAEKQKRKGKKQQAEADELVTGQVRAFNRVVAYCTEARCRRGMLLQHFGEQLQQCTGCDYCDDPALAAAKVRYHRCTLLLATIRIRSLVEDVSAAAQVHASSSLLPTASTMR